MILALRWRPPERQLRLRWRTPLTAPRAFAQPEPTAAAAAIIGPPGAGGTRFTYRQASASPEWVVNHNLGVEPASVTVKSPGGVEVVAEVVHVSLNQLRIRFAAPASGSAIIL